MVRCLKVVKQKLIDLGLPGVRPSKMTRIGSVIQYRKTRLSILFVMPLRLSQDTSRYLNYNVLRYPSDILFS